MTAKEYITSWDKKIHQWAGIDENGQQIEIEEPVFTEAQYWNPKKMGLLLNLMPEPYWGNWEPGESSCVILNLNPYGDTQPKEDDPSLWDRARKGDVTSVSGLMSGNYSDYAKYYSILTDERSYLPTVLQTYPGYEWWHKNRLPWVKRLFGEQAKPPFAFELCGWHSPRWKNAEFTEEYCKEVGEALTEIISNTTTQIGLALGADYPRILEEKLGYETRRLIDILSECGAQERIMNLSLELNKENGLWYPIKGNNRRYKVLSKTQDGKKAIVICTWYQGGFRTPGEGFRKFESELLKAVDVLRDGGKWGLRNVENKREEN